MFEREFVISSLKIIVEMNDLDWHLDAQIVKGSITSHYKKLEIFHIKKK